MTSKRSLLLASLSGAALLCGPTAQRSAAQAADSAHAKTTEFVGATLIDGTGHAPLRNSIIVVTGDRIVAAGSRDSVVAPRDARVVRLDGRFVVPGLINSHVHLATDPNPPDARRYLRRELYSGVTAVRDMAGDARLLAELKREAFLSEIVAPDVYFAALMAGPSFFVDARTHQSTRGLTPGAPPWMRAITSQTDLPLAVAEARGTGATGIKLYADLPAQLVSAITAEAHRQHMLVWAHAAVFPASPLDIAKAGVDVMSHAAFLGYQVEQVPASFEAMTPVRDRAWDREPAIQELLGEMQQRDIILDATVETFYRSPLPMWPPSVSASLTHEAYEKGVLISAGTDDDFDWTSPHSALDNEIERLVRNAGMTPMDAIRSATSVGARTVGEEHAMGTIEAGKLANFAILSRDPLADIGNIESVVATVKRGIVYSRREFRPRRNFGASHRGTTGNTTCDGCAASCMMR